MENSQQAFAELLSFAVAMYHMYYNFHWKSSGASYYSDHLLYERLQDSVGEEIDAVAEKGISILDNPEIFSPARDLMRSATILAKYFKVESPGSDMFPKIALKVEKDFLDLLKVVGETLLKEGLKTEGAEDLLAGMAGKHDEHIYLLRQRGKDSGGGVAKKELSELADELDKSGCFDAASDVDKIIRL